jgi:hypothetical protein
VSLGLEDSEFSAVGVLLHDPSLNAVNFASDHGIGVLLITGGVFEFGVDAIPGMLAGRSAPVVWAGHWFAGAVTIPALYLAKTFARIDRVRVSILIDRDVGAATSGPATIKDFQRITAHSPSVVQRVAGQYVWTPVAQTREDVERLDGTTIEARGSVSNDVLSIGAATRAADIKVLEAWGVSASRAQGGPAADEVSIEMSGAGLDGQPMRRFISLSCPRTTTSLTVMTTATLLERLAGLDGAPPLQPGYYLSEHVLDSEAFVRLLRAEGCVIQIT